MRFNNFDPLAGRFTESEIEARARDLFDEMFNENIEEILGLVWSGLPICAAERLLELRTQAFQNAEESLESEMAGA